MSHARNSRSAFTLIELLIVIAIIAVLAVVVVLVVNPAELLRQARDSQRFSDLSTMTSATGIYLANSNNIGNSSTTYVSIADPSATSTAGDQCQGLGMYSLASGDSYQCAASSTLRRLDGTGWMPTNFSSLPAGSPIGSLPVDPLNQTSTGYFYTYTARSTQYEVTALVESIKYRAQLLANPATPIFYHTAVQGSNLTLSELWSTNGLLTAWPINEGSGSTTIDTSGNGDGGNWAGTAAGNSSTYYIKGGQGNSIAAGYFDGSSNYVLNTQTINTPYVSIAAWVYIPSLPSSNAAILGFANGNGGSTADKGLFLDNTGRLYFYVFDGAAKFTSAPANALPLNQWVFVAGTADGSNAISYVNGVQVGSVAAGATFTGYSSPDFLVGGHTTSLGYLNEVVGNVLLYNRALSAAEIQALYLSQK
jgi:prepilin-type N-terminal cleavage/methylation domain-containing protein